MRIPAFVEEAPVIRKILEHQGLFGRIVSVSSRNEIVFTSSRKTKILTAGIPGIH